MENDYHKLDVICLYKPQGKIPSYLLSWLKEDEERKIICIEEKKTLLKKKISKNVEMVCFASQEEVREKLLTIAWQNVFLSIGLLGKQDKEFIAVQKLFQEMVIATQLILSDYSDFGLKAFKNTLANILKCENKDGASLFDKYKNKPAVICGAGPSFADVAPVLKKYKNKAIFFAGGTALMCALKYGVHVDFGAAVDKNEPIPRKGIENIPLFYESRLHPDFASFIKAPLLLICSYATPLEEWFLKKLNIIHQNKHVDGGWTVTTFLVELAYLMGCSPIILAGVDLCITNKKQKYAKGIKGEVKACNLITENEKKTQKDWFLARKWLDSFVKDHPGLPILNLSKELNIAKKIDTKALKNYLKYNIVKPSYLKIPPVKVNKKIAKTLLAEMQKSMLACLAICQEINEQNIDTLKERLSSQPGYEYFLRPLWELFQYPIMRKVATPSANLYAINQAIFFMKALEEYKNAIS